MIVNQLNKQREFIERSVINPELLFDKASTTLNRKNTVFKIMSVYEDGQRKMDVHEFQTFLCSIIRDFFKSVLNDERVSIRVRDRMRYPSIFAVYYNDNEIIQFDIFERYYGKRNMKTKEEIELYYKKQENEKLEELEFVNKKISNMQAAKANTLKWIVDFHKNKDKGILNKLYYGVKEVITYFPQRDKIRKLIDDALAKYDTQLEEIKNRYEKYSNMEADLTNLKLKEDIVSLVEPIFIKYNYRLETENHKLY